ncbi:M48 family metallopeptidase [Puniceicoccaceae bacterium K14]|nr:M48 family metallopeptidase [Puniceicoccaceae bacterium K14]
MIRFFCGNENESEQSIKANVKRGNIELKRDSIKEGDVSFRKNSRARHYLVRVDTTGAIILTIPSRGTKKEALEFANEHGEWLRQKQQETIAQKEQSKLCDGSKVLLAGEWETLKITKDRGRPVLTLGVLSSYIADETSDHRWSLSELMKNEAKRWFPDRVKGLATNHNIAFERVVVRGQKTRWGSCSSSGTISLNWKLVQAPVWVRDYVIVHELMHVREMNHSDRFWRLVENAFPAYKEAEKWLDDNSRWMNW